MQIWEEMSQRVSLHNKHLGVISSDRLLSYNIQTPNIQRIRDDKKVDEIVAYQQACLRKDGQCNFVGVINIHFCEDTSELYLTDGQHRYEAVKRINSTINVPIAIEVVIVQTMEQLKDNYNLINKNTPMPDFPDTIDKTIPENVALYFRDRYSTIWSSSARARRPHICFNYFQEALGVLTDKLEIKTAVDLQKIVEDYNAKLGNWDPSQYPDAKTVMKNPSVLNKCKETGFYLGLYRHVSDEHRYEWVKEILRIEKGIVCKKAPSACESGKKKAVPKKIRDDAWNKHCGKRSEVLCICCRTSVLTPFSFHAGHVVSDHDGGATTVDNIRPICSACNLSMGKRNMGEFVLTHFPKNKVKFDAVAYDVVKDEKKPFSFFTK
jgi:hypothetical protein